MPAVPGAAFTPGDEDCLFLNVYSPATADAGKKLPVLVWIHGGGYGMGDGRQDLTEIMEANGNSFVGVSIQYRVGCLFFISTLFFWSLLTGGGKWGTVGPGAVWRSREVLLRGC